MMQNHDISNDDIRERAALYCFNLLEPLQVVEFELHLKSCRICASEVRAFAESDAAFPNPFPGESPSPDVRKGFWIGSRDFRGAGRGAGENRRPRNEQPPARLNLGVVLTLETFECQLAGPLISRTLKSLRRTSISTAE